MARHHSRRSSRSGSKSKMPGGMILIVGVAAIGLALYAIMKAKKGQGATAAPALAYGPFPYPAIGAYSPFAGQLSGMGIGGQQEVGVEPQLLKYLTASQFSNEIGYTLNRVAQSESGGISGAGGATAQVSGKAAGSRLGMHGDPSYSGLERNTPYYHGIPLPDPVRITRVTIAGGPGKGNDYGGALAIGFRP